MAKKYYAVRRGRNTGIFESWDECKRQVMGFAGASYKGFTDRAEAEAFLDDKQKECGSRDGAVKAYVDGSYNIRTKIFSFGAVIFDNGQEVLMKQSFNDPEMASMRNVAGEINGSMAAMKYCMENGKTKLDLYYDYEGIEKWCTGEWKANKTGTISYKKYYDSLKDTLDVRFIKVKGHSGDKYNDMADALAKQAADII